MRIFFSLVLIISITLAPLTFVHAREMDIETLERQLGAIQSYISRTFGTDTTSMSSKAYERSIGAGVEWFRNAQESSGHFRYEYAPYKGTYSSDDNIVRQTGALYALGEILRRDQNDPLNVAPIMKRSISYFEGLSRKDTYGSNSFRCITKSKESTSCEVGATSLALTGLIAYAESNASRAREYKNLINEYASFILAMQKENGGFRNPYRIGWNKQTEKESPFANGEALLALARYAEYSISTEAKDVVQKAFEYLRREPYDPNLHLWMLAALGTMHDLWGKDEYLTYAEDYTDWRVSDALRMSNPTRNYCAYSEGLASALALLKDYLPSEKFSLWKTELDTRNRRHFALQLTAADRIRLLSDEGAVVFRELNNPEQAYGGFLTGDAEPVQRIDFTQHCITGFVHTLELESSMR